MQNRNLCTASGPGSWPELSRPGSAIGAESILRTLTVGVRRRLWPAWPPGKLLTPRSTLTPSAGALAPVRVIIWRAPQDPFKKVSHAMGKLRAQVTNQVTTHADGFGSRPIQPDWAGAMPSAWSLIGVAPARELWVRRRGAGEICAADRECV